jgi:hypothetical protein
MIRWNVDASTIVVWRFQPKALRGCGYRIIWQYDKSYHEDCSCSFRKRRHDMSHPVHSTDTVENDPPLTIVPQHYIPQGLLEVQMLGPSPFTICV